MGFFAFIAVSTHSRLKAAGRGTSSTSPFDFGFNTQPPEGGWKIRGNLILRIAVVSTHSRLKAAGSPQDINSNLKPVSTHSRLKAAGLDQSNLASNITFQHTAA